MTAGPVRIDPVAFIRESLRLMPAPGFPHLTLYTPHPGSRLSRLEHLGAAPYWAYVWSGGAAIARHADAHPDAFAGRRVLDFGCGCGIVGIAAARAGATVFATDIDPFARAATALNATENRVAVEIVEPDAPVPAIDLVLAGDVFYDAAIARLTSPLLDGFRLAGTAVWVGDPDRPHLPRERLTELARYDVPEFGHGAGGTSAAVYAYRA